MAAARCPAVNDSGDRRHARTATFRSSARLRDASAELRVGAGRGGVVEVAREPPDDDREVRLVRQRVEGSAFTPGSKIGFDAGAVAPRIDRDPSGGEPAFLQEVGKPL